MRYITKELLAAAAIILFIGCYNSSSFVDSDDSSTDDSSSSDDNSEEYSDYEANQMIDECMLNNYLYNEEYSTIARDLTTDYYSMFYGTLISMTTNTLDKKAVDGVWGYYSIYSYLTRYETATKADIESKATATTSNSFGFISMEYVQMSIDGSTEVVMAVNGIYNNSPASNASIGRGSVITAIDGISVTTLYYAGSTLLSTLVSPYDGQTAELTLYNTESNVTITAEYIELCPVLYALEVSEGIGYLNLCSFDYYYNEDLLTALDTLNSAGISELILDLRLNKGGHIISSNTLNTALTNSSSDEIFCYYRFNDYLTSKNASTTNTLSLEYESSTELFYDYSVSFLSDRNRLNLDRVYCLVSDDTASASELVINALNCSDVEVILIGATTEGKNVGSYSYTFSSNGYSYELAPIMFELFNKDYVGEYYDGFDPDYEVNEYSSFCDFGTSEPLIAKALELSRSNSDSSSQSISFSDSTPNTRAVDNAIEPMGESLRDPRVREGAEILSKN